MSETNEIKTTENTEALKAPEKLPGRDGDMPGRFYGRFVLYSVPLPYISPLAVSDECSAVYLTQSSFPVHRAEDGSPRGELQRMQVVFMWYDPRGELSTL